MPSLPSSAYYSGALFGDIGHNTLRVQRMVALDFVVLTLGSFLQTVHHGVGMRYYRGRIQKACEGGGTLVALNKRIWTSLGGIWDCAYAKLFDVYLLQDCSHFLLALS